MWVGDVCAPSATSHNSRALSANRPITGAVHRTLAVLVALGAIVASTAGARAGSADGGTQLWASHYDGPGNSLDQASSVGVSPDGTTVFVTGTRVGATTAEDFATIAYVAGTG